MLRGAMVICGGVSGSSSARVMEEAIEATSSGKAGIYPSPPLHFVQTTESTKRFRHESISATPQGTRQIPALSGEYLRFPLPSDEKVEQVTRKNPIHGHPGKPWRSKGWLCPGFRRHLNVQSCLDTWQHSNATQAFSPELARTEGKVCQQSERGGEGITHPGTTAWQASELTLAGRSSKASYRRASSSVAPL